MKTYFTFIRYTQTLLLIAGIGTLMILPQLIVFAPDLITPTVATNLYSVAHALLLFVMAVRPLADIFTSQRWIRPLVQLRKGTGVLAAALVISFMLAKIMMGPTDWFAALGTASYWSLTDLALLAHLADITGIILLITSNNFSKRVLGDWWKRTQRLSYVFFYASAVYVVASYGDIIVLNYIFIVTILTIMAWTLNQSRRSQEPA